MDGKLRFMLLLGVVVLSHHYALGFAHFDFNSENAIEQFHVRNDFRYNKKLRQGGDDISEAREHLLANLIDVSTCLPDKILDFSSKYVALSNIPKGDAVNSLAPFRNIFCDNVDCPMQVSASDITCDPSYKYRSIDGHCNNLKNPLFGSSERNLARFNNYLPDYEDGITIARGVGRAIPLPRPRDVSLAMTNTEATGTSADTLLLMQWGQFMDHDLVLSPESAVGLDSEGAIVHLECCEDKVLEGPVPKNCMPLDVTNDDFFESHGVECRRFIRGLAFTNGCELGPRQQLNLLTSFVDGSQVYGSTPVEEDILRTHVDGRLKTNDESETGSCEVYNPLCYLPETPGNVLVGGDERAMEQPGLTSMHTLFFRLHNFLAESLKSKYPNRDDEYIFQEARRIVSSVIQNIHYDEFLPSVIGSVEMSKHRLWIQQSGRTNGYDDTIDATAFNVFSAAAFRFGHSLIKDQYELANATVILAASFLNRPVTTTLHQHPSDFLQGMSAITAMPQDQILVETLTNKLFAQGPEFAVGTDLYSLNIQRARDHGVPPYNFWRQQCGLQTFENFSSMEGFLRPDAINALREVYNDRIEDLDIFPAAMSELPENPGDGILGPTFSCILGTQFEFMKYGDRFWFEDESQPVPFTDSQLDAIRKTTLGSLICSFTTSTSVQRDAMRIRSLPGNSPVPCSTSFGNVVEKVLIEW